MTEALIAGGLVGLIIALIRKLDSLTFAHLEWRLVQLKFAEPRRKTKKPIDAKAPRAVKASRVPRQLKQVKSIPRQSEDVRKYSRRLPNSERA